MEASQWSQSAIPRPTILWSMTMTQNSLAATSLDANNLYGWAMSQPLPTGAFRWEEDCEQLAKTIADHPADDPEGFLLEVDLEYPEDLHNAHKAYLLAPERMLVRKKSELVRVSAEYQHNRC